MNKKVLAIVAVLALWGNTAHADQWWNEPPPPPAPVAAAAAPAPAPAIQISAPIAPLRSPLDPRYPPAGWCDSMGYKGKMCLIKWDEYNNPRPNPKP